MKIQIDPHTLERAEERGATEDEIRDVILTGTQIKAKRGRRGNAKVFDYNKTRLGKHYKQKKVEVIYTVENEVFITVTVYVFYGEWEK